MLVRLTPAKTAAKENCFAHREGLTFDAKNQTVGDYLDRWLNDSVRDTVRKGTFERHEQIIRLHIRPSLGTMRLKRLV